MANKLAKVVITLDGSRVEVGLDKIREKTQQLVREMNSLAAAGKQNTTEYKERVKAVNKLHKAEQDVVDVTKRISQYMKDLGNVATTDLRRAYREGVQLREGFKGTDLQLKQLNSDLAAMKAQIDRNTGSTTAMAKAQQGFAGALGTTLKNLVAYMGVFAMFNKAKAMFGEFIEKNREFSDQLANVRKVSNLAMGDIDKLAVSLSKIDSRTSLKGLMELSYTGAKLGFGNYGIEGLESFARSAVKVQNALSEDMGADAMTALSKMVEVMGLIPKMGVERAMDAAGSAIFKLASTSTATGTNIVEFSKRLMGLANIAHITTPELLAIGSAADSMALMPEVAATAFNKLITAVQKQPNLIENALKIDKGTISDLFQAGKMTDALVLIFEKMREKGGMNALMQSGVFKDLGSDGARLVAVMATMANRVDMLNAHLAVSRQAFEEGTAVAQEYAIQMDTAAAYSERAANIWEKAFVNPEGVDVVKDLSKAWYEVSKSLTENEKIMFGIKISLQGIILLLKTILTILPEIIFTLGIAGMASMIARMREGEGLLASLTAWFGKLSAAQKVFFKAAGWVGLAITIFEVGKAVYDLAIKTKEAAIYMEGFKDNLTELDIEFGKSEAELNRYRRAIDEAAYGTKQRAAAITNFNSKFGAYLKNMLTEKSTANDVADAYDRITSAMRAKLAMQLKEKDINDQVLPREQWTAQRRLEYDTLAKNAGLGQYGASWITGYAQDNRNKSVDAMLRDIGKQYYNLPQKVLEEIMTQANSGAREFNNYGNIINSRYLGKANALLAAGSYFRQNRSAETALNRVNYKYKPEQAAIDAYVASQRKDETIDALEPAPERGGGKGGTQTDETKKLFEEQKKRVEGLIAKIDQWYNLQDATINDFAATGRITDEEAKQALNAMKIARNIALEKARLAVASGNDTDWRQFYQENMAKMMIDHGEWSTELFYQIGEVDIKALHDFLSHIQDPDMMAKLDASSFFDTMRKKAAESKKVVSETQAKATEELNNMLLKYEYFDQAARQFANNLIKIGALGTTAEQMAEGMEGAPTAEQSIEAVKGMLAAMVRQGVGLYQVNPADAKGVADMLRSTVTEAMTEADYLAGKTSGEQAHWFDMFPELKDWMNNPEQHKQELEQFYNVMLLAEQDYYNKRKQSYEHEKRQQETRFRAAGYTEQESKEQAALKTLGEQKDAGIGASFAEQQGLGKIANDPEVMAIQNRIYWRNEEVKAAQARIDALKAQQQQELADLQAKQAEEFRLKEAANATADDLEKLRLEHRQQIIDLEAAQNAQRMGAEDMLKEYQAKLFEQETILATKVSQELQKRVQTINSLTKPITDFTQAAGRKIGDMIFNMESEEATWEELWKNMALAVGESVIQMGAQYAQNLLMQQAMNRASEAETVADAGVKVSAGIAAGSAKTIGELGWWGIPLIGIISSLLMGLLQSALSTKSNKDSSSSSTSSSSNAIKTKLVSGMLTYDEGNVGTYQGTDGQSYHATQVSAPADGLVTQPIATTVQGQPALVAERGPEIVIGRRTTRAIMMNEPGLIRYLANYSKSGGASAGPRYRAFDGGNLDDITQLLPDGQTTTGGGGITAADAQKLVAAIGAFNQTVNQMQQKGIPCYINKYGSGGLIDEVKSGMKFDSKYNK